MLNMTPHNISILSKGEVINIPPCGQVPRVVMNNEERESLIRDNMQINICTVKYGEIEWNGPEPTEPFIVSKVVADAVVNEGGIHARCFYPDSGPSAIRDDNGHVVAVRRLIEVY